MLPRIVKHEDGIDVAGWEIRVRKNPILSSAQFEQWEKELKAESLPEMVFGDSVVSLRFVSPTKPTTTKPTTPTTATTATTAASATTTTTTTAVAASATTQGAAATTAQKQHTTTTATTTTATTTTTTKEPFTLEFGAREALQLWADNAHSVPPPSVAHSSSWAKEHADTIAGMETKKYDWTFTTLYTGRVSGGSAAGKPIEERDGKLPLDKLTAHDPILFFDEVILFEDELADNGSAMLSVKLRAMPTLYFVLLRFFLRVDDVLFRAIDTRYCHEYNSPFVLRERTIREATYEELEKAGKLPTERSKLGNEHHMCELLPIRGRSFEKLPL